tara:strand:+ start:838 stop:1176 length:339 start_codon:yes stop_codon:yes gene_type:complete
MRYQNRENKEIAFKDDEQSDFVCAGLCLAIIGVVMAGVETTRSIVKKKNVAAEERRAARMKFYKQLALINEQRVIEGKKKLTTEMLALVTIVIVIAVTILLYKFTFAITARN